MTERYEGMSPLERMADSLAHGPCDERVYEIIGTHSGWAVKREDGAIAEFLGKNEAVEAKESLESGEASESDYDWRIGYSS